MRDRIQRQAKTPEPERNVQSRMRHAPISSDLFTAHRERLKKLLRPGSIAVVNSNDLPSSNADGSLRLIPNSDLFYLTGIEQEESILLLYPDAEDEAHREILFLREPKPETEIWEGHKLTRDEARRASGIKQIHWLGEFPRLFRRFMCHCDHVYLNSNEYPANGQWRRGRIADCDGLAAPGRAVQGLIQLIIK